MNLREYLEYVQMVIINNYECWYFNILFGGNVEALKEWNNYYKTDVMRSPGSTK